MVIAGPAELCVGALVLSEEEDVETCRPMYGTSAECRDQSSADGGEGRCQCGTPPTRLDQKSPEKNSSSAARPATGGGNNQDSEDLRTTGGIGVGSQKGGKREESEERENDEYGGDESGFSSCGDSVASGCTLRIAKTDSEEDDKQELSDSSERKRRGMERERLWRRSGAKQRKDDAAAMREVRQGDEGAQSEEEEEEEAQETILISSQEAPLPSREQVDPTPALDEKAATVQSSTEILCRDPRGDRPNIRKNTRGSETAELHLLEIADQPTAQETPSKGIAREEERKEGRLLNNTGDACCQLDVASHDQGYFHAGDYRARKRPHQEEKQEEAEGLRDRLTTPQEQPAHNSPVELVDVDTEWLRRSLPTGLQGQQVLEDPGKKEEDVGLRVVPGSRPRMLPPSISGPQTGTVTRQKVKDRRADEVRPLRRGSLDRGREQEVKKKRREQGLPVVCDKKKPRGGSTPKQIPKPRLTLENFFR